ncbi:sensor histidine kinase [Flavicella marina]|uniref:sensor histidine kinase n=1 Tax=Flavicella marina TaxID=1475951 RepID=UPI0012641B11|nr:histidine kinase [Flavicella marina]
MFSDLNSELYSWIRGAILLLFLINAGLYLQNGKRLFLNYSLYLLFVFLYFIKSVVPESFHQFYSLFGYSFLFLSFVFYIEFERILLTTSVNTPRWDKYFKFEQYSIVIGASILPFVQYLFGSHVLITVVFILLNLLSVFTVLTYFEISKIKGRNAYNFIIGSSFFLIFGNWGIYYRFLNRNSIENLLFEPVFFCYLGVMLEAFMFTYIMGNIFEQVLEKKTDLKIQYALKQKEAAELKMSALQSQMNPHFIFNSLNSINNFVLKNKKEEASDYITSFSKLIRRILKNSENSEISLFLELEVLDIYVDLERKRVTGGFEFHKEIDPLLNLHEISVPPLFLQPYIENSIWHGLAGKEGEKRIDLTILKKKEEVVIFIRDNGVGINEKVKSQNKKSSKRKFFGSLATEKRIKLLHESSKVDITTVNILEKESSGTEVCIKFPLRKDN